MLRKYIVQFYLVTRVALPRILYYVEKVGKIVAGYRVSSIEKRGQTSPTLFRGVKGRQWSVPILQPPLRANSSAFDQSIVRVEWGDCRVESSQEGIFRDGRWSATIIVTYACRAAHQGFLSLSRRHDRDLWFVSPIGKMEHIHTLEIVERGSFSSGLTRARSARCTTYAEWIIAFNCAHGNGAGWTNFRVGKTEILRTNEGFSTRRVVQTHPPIKLDWMFQEAALIPHSDECRSLWKHKTDHVRLL